MRVILYALLLLPFISFAQNGIIQGNVFWKYNDYIGNKPDAGSEVYLFSKDTSVSPKETQCDVMGNFKFENIVPGDYGIIVISENTKDNGDYAFDWFNIFHKESKVFLGFDITECYQYKSLDSLNEVLKTTKNDDYAINQKKITLWNYNKRDIENKEADLKVEESGQNISKQKYLILQSGYKNCYKICNSIFNSYAIILNRKTYFQPVTIKGNENKTVIADFGITYSL